ncbi:MAG: hypothetical protein IPP74_07915 [Alphaproteobacteria bacterium]|nr:hypothetical protein [Alphaproteobacteria bacterium]
MIKNIIINTCYNSVALLIFILLPCLSLKAQEATEIKKESYDRFWPNIKKEYKYPVRINIMYTGDAVPGGFGKDTPEEKLENIEINRDTLKIIHRNIINDADYLSNKSSKKGNYLNYLQTPIALKEGYIKHKLVFPLDCGYITIDKHHYIWASPPDNACRWLLYNFEHMVDKNSVFQIYFLSDVRPIPEMKSGMRRYGTRLESFERNDPYYAQGLIRYLEQEGFRIKAIEEGVKLDSIDYKAE